ncbi:AfsR/SARP family transcriptional regulator [Plantactinospora sp. S1510]|uniref:AfsR/SARP family transcriptional regulator n=1 Tax=Plantactinospora alkalitolerans TaxID=2789879 RepID=A0ABS0GVV6_9ACTN|nr:AfsR/SARP family transcriptional regulator [Plantactinospora alkalitolerans]MBF9130133.1 AfsR/SARP family transcriptional regulator [Plantactinospora alkalitolerans]
MPEDDLSILLLGPIRAARGGTALYLATPRQREVLAVLALRSGMVLSVPQIVDAIWSERRPDSVENMVHTYIGRLRRVLEPPGRPPALARVLRSTRPGYTLDLPAEAVDITLFERDVKVARAARTQGDLSRALCYFQQGLARWSGLALQEAAGPLAEAERIRLTELRQDAVEESTGVRLLLGDVENLVSELRCMLAEQPMRERLWELLLVVLGQTSRRAEALTAFEDARVTLADRLGVEPGHRLQDLHRRLLRSEPVSVRPWWERRVPV